ncbi:hypothetical protein B6D87_23570 (plasmid) [Pseudomonas fragi]|jgi:hypothetical protein|uniref:hypothetical protein n=1 Tax=Pseudomonas TaxID=286 RepID=UPI000A2A063A|nr:MULTISPECIES: hypothetical protein [Pseudomonas]ARQ77149.1 hypothetical protein B6D87_23570 [Pseudomonas fragi]MBO4968426.1 hypothetical protein [Pseudomonas sp.]NWD80874.1 hypothetical protein [Pseudomonas reactans]
MLKFKLHHVLSVVVAVVVVGSVVYINTASYFSTEPAEPGNPTAPISVGKNPLLSASKRDVGNWFPGTCFAEIYMKSSSYGGSLVQGCIEQTSREIKAQTGVQLSASDFRDPEVLSHFKGVYGASNPWRS